ncbi:MAG TPA: class I SAM-dependent methyltransferase [Anaerolineales bacterium]|nr:class I SAM-dependent methyltransferase [Anaerolineales bacterium]
MNIGTFQEYLLAKQSVDDRALNKDVLAALKAHLPPAPLSIVEVGAGIGTMLVRLLRWEILSDAEYLLIDEMADNVSFGMEFVSKWAEENGFKVLSVGADTLHLSNPSRSITAKFIHANMFDFISSRPSPADLLIAHAVLDILPLPESLPRLFSLTKDLAWLTINFDGASILKPAIDPALDRRIERLYHETMDSRPGGGESQSGQNLFAYLDQFKADILEAGSSDWVVYPRQGKYTVDEAAFLQYILGFFEESLTAHPDLDTGKFSRWLDTRRNQIAKGELVYIAHQLDFLVGVYKNHPIPSMGKP